MREFQKVIIGATCRAAGSVLEGNSNDLVVERSASIGGEYFDSYRRCSNWERKPEGEEARAFYEEMAARGQIAGDLSDAYGLAPLLYFRLKGLAHKFMLTAELLSVKGAKGGFELELCNQSGRETVRCAELIDNSLRCVSDPVWGRGNVAAKSLNAALLVEDAPEALKGRIEGATLRPGRSSKEIFLGFQTSPGAGWVEARAALLKAFEAREGVLKGARIEALAKDFDIVHKREEFEFDDGRLFLSCVAPANPLEAIELGLNVAEEARR